MTDTAVLNGSQSKATELSEEQYRALCKQLRAEQIRRGKGKKKSKPILKPIGDVNTIQKIFIVSKAPTDFDELKTGMPFALDPTGTLLFTKTGKERCICLNTMQPQAVSAASVYRVFL